MGGARVCPECGGEYGDGVDACADCGVTLEAEPESADLDPPAARVDRVAMSFEGLEIRLARPGDAATVCRMRLALWPEGSMEGHAGELSAFFAGRSREPQAILVAEADGGGLVGFCELSIRPCAEGCLTDRVGYLEGWYVDPAVRRRGVGRALVEGGEAWARSRGCTEFASDAAIDDEDSIAAHRALGFADAGVVRCFRKDLPAGGHG